jgi:hypothetical protein
MSIGLIILIILILILLGGFSGFGGGPFYGTGYYGGTSGPTLRKGCAGSVRRGLSVLGISKTKFDVSSSKLSGQTSFYAGRALSPRSSSFRTALP